MFDHMQMHCSLNFIHSYTNIFLLTFFLNSYGTGWFCILKEMATKI